MDMKIDANKIIAARKLKAWSQQHLADVSGLSLRTIQRLENTSAGSPDSIKAVAMAFDKIPADFAVASTSTNSQTEDSKNLQKGASRFNSKYVVAIIVAAFGLGASVWLSARPTSEAVLQADIQEKSTTLEAEQGSMIQTAAFAWIALIDSGEYLKSYEQADTIVRNQVSAQQWQSAIEAAKASYGNNVEREISSIQLASSLPGVPDGEYAIVVFHSKFENKAKAEESLPMSKSIGEWRPIGYFIR